MFYQDDMTIDKKYMNIINIPIYNTEKKLHGILSEISLLRLSNGLYIQYKAFYDNVNREDTIYKDDFEKGIVKFVLLNDGNWQKGHLKEMQEMQIQAIKEFLGEDHDKDSVIWISEQERKKQLEEQEYRQKNKIGDCTKWAESATRELIFENYSAIRIFSLYVDEVITKEQFLIELVNILAEEKRVYRDVSLNSGTKSFINDIRKVFDENRDFLKETMKELEE